MLDQHGLAPQTDPAAGLVQVNTQLPAALGRLVGPQRRLVQLGGPVRREAAVRAARDCVGGFEWTDGWISQSGKSHAYQSQARSKSHPPTRVLADPAARSEEARQEVVRPRRGSPATRRWRVGMRPVARLGAAGGDDPAALHGRELGGVGRRDGQAVEGCTCQDDEDVHAVPPWDGMGWDEVWCVVMLCE